MRELPQGLLTQHALMVAWGEFVHEIGLIPKLLGVPLPQKSVVVTHGLPAFTLMHVAKGNVESVPIWDHSIDNCSITYLKGGRVIWHGRNLYHEIAEYDRARYQRSAHNGVTRQTESNTTPNSKGIEPRDG